MLCNLHTHTTFCDGKDTAEDVVISAIEKGFSSLGFSSHGVSVTSCNYCLRAEQSYINEINRLKQKYKDKIQIYLGIEEEALCYVNRNNYDYIIGSSHYFSVDGKLYPIDSNAQAFDKCLELFSFDVEKLSETYYSAFANYVITRKPDVVGHYDLITKFDEKSRLFLKNTAYEKIAEKYLRKILDETDCIIELNTGAISRGMRTTPYPADNLLKLICEHNGKITITSDSHSKLTLDTWFDEAKKLLKTIGFNHTYVLYDGKWQKDYL